MKCSKCGNKIFADDKFCGSCGAKNPTYKLSDNDDKNKLNKVDNAVEPDGSKMKKYVIVIAAIALLLLGIAAALFGYILYGGANPSDKTDKTAAASQTPEQVTEAAVARYETYYVVNCKTAISLRESPDNSAIVIAEIPLGTPVSYVEPAQNGFAKIIYNGTTGYALQSYLSNDPEDIKRNSPTPTPNTGNNGKPGSSAGGYQASYGAVSNPGFYSYNDNEYGFSCEYPSHFTAAAGNSKFVRRSYKAPDNTATLNICATKNTTGRSAKKVQDNFKSSYPGTVDYENIGSDWCVCRTYKDGMYHYGYFSLKNGMIRGFEMHFDGAYFQTYETYVNYIYDSLILN